MSKSETDLFRSSRFGFRISRAERGEVPKWSNGADCKSAGLCLRWFESIPLHHLRPQGLVQSHRETLATRSPGKYTRTYTQRLFAGVWAQPAAETDSRHNHGQTISGSGATDALGVLEPVQAHRRTHTPPCHRKSPTTKQKSWSVRHWDPPASDILENGSLYSLSGVSSAVRLLT